MQDLDGKKGETIIPPWQQLADTRAHNKHWVCSSFQASSWETFALMLPASQVTSSGVLWVQHFSTFSKQEAVLSDLHYPRPFSGFVSIQLIYFIKSVLAKIPRMVSVFLTGTDG